MEVVTNVIVMVLMLIIADYSDVFIGTNVLVDWFMFFFVIYHTAILEKESEIRFVELQS